MQGAIAECIHKLVSDPTNHGLAIHQVTGHEGVWEAKVDQGNRLTFEYLEDGRVLLRNHCNHDMLDRSP